MAMLAEPRRKQRWTLNPRGKDWSNDTNKFGQRMLEKMGWTSGKGLGLNEQGTTEHVKVSVKNNTSGVGFKNEQDKAWTEHREAFDSLLSHLQKNQNPDAIIETGTENSLTSTQSLELRSKQSRARVHYQKFTRGKDVKKYSAKDLADILGGRNILNKENNTKELEEKSTDSSNTENNAQMQPSGLVTINRGSISDYFKKKSPHFLRDKDNNNTPADKDENETEQYRGFGFVSKPSEGEKTKKSKQECNYIFDNPALDLRSTNDVAITEENQKIINKRKGEFSSESDQENVDAKRNFAKKVKIEADVNNSKEGFVNMALDLDNQVTESHAANKFEVPRAQFGLTNDALDLTDESCDKKRVTFNDHVEYSTDPVKKKKCTGKLDKFEVESKKKKKKQKEAVANVDASNKIGFINEALDMNLISDESKDNEANEYKSKKNKRHKDRRRMSNLETIEEASEEVNTNGVREVENSAENIINEEDLPKKKKKKKKTKECIPIADNTDEPMVLTEENVDCSRKEGKSKKKGSKHAKINGDPDTTGEVEEELKIVEESIVDVKPKKALKLKKKHKEKSRKSENLDNNDDQEISFVDKGIRIKKKKPTNYKDGEISHGGVTKKLKTVKQCDTNHDDSSVITNKDTTEDDTEIRLQNKEIVRINSEDITNNVRVETDNNSFKLRTRGSRMLKSFIRFNYLSDFPGSNMNEIKGYGGDVI